MAPNCQTPLTLRNFQMAALDDSVLDVMTDRPLKVLVCKDHVPMPKHSISTDALAFKHTASAPKPSVPGLHRSLMGGRGTGPAMEDWRQTKVDSPRSLAQGSHAEILKSLIVTNEDTESATTGIDKKGPSNMEGLEEKGDRASPTSATTTTLPKYRRGRFTVTDSDSIAVSHAAAEDAQDPTKDDDSFRTLPVRHQDYGHKEGHTKVGHGDNKKNTENWNDDENLENKTTDQDNKQERIFTMKDATSSSNSRKATATKHHHGVDEEEKEVQVSLETPMDMTERARRDHLKVNLEDDKQIEAAEMKAPQGAEEAKKLVDLAFSSKLMQNHRGKIGSHAKNKGSLNADQKVADDDEWDVDIGATDDVNRREPIAGI
ncbi:hypothetical protein BGX28_006393 [Mortierella sp. GBA30]|nr:hypothetical protein BGX28_006393 [Mortierella sp. GBA30]